MASNKKRRKRANAERRGRRNQPSAVQDGDRRRRVGPLARQALERKRSIHDWTIDDDPIAHPEAFGIDPVDDVSES